VVPRNAGYRCAIRLASRAGNVVVPASLEAEAAHAGKRRTAIEFRMARPTQQRSQGAAFSKEAREPPSTASTIDVGNYLRFPTRMDAGVPICSAYTSKPIKEEEYGRLARGRAIRVQDRNRRSGLERVFESQTCVVSGRSASWR